MMSMNLDPKANELCTSSHSLYDATVSTESILNDENLDYYAVIQQFDALISELRDPDKKKECVDSLAETKNFQSIVQENKPILCKNSGRETLFLETACKPPSIGVEPHSPVSSLDSCKLTKGTESCASFQDSNQNIIHNISTGVSNLMSHLEFDPGYLSSSASKTIKYIKWQKPSYELNSSSHSSMYKDIVSLPNNCGTERGKRIYVCNPNSECCQTFDSLKINRTETYSKPLSVWKDRNLPAFPIIRHHRRLDQRSHSLSILGPGSHYKYFLVKLFIDTKDCHLGPFTFEVFSQMTLRLLKLKVEEEYGIISSSQKWIMGKHFAVDDDKCLVDYDVKPDSSIILYVDSKSLNMKRNFHEFVDTATRQFMSSKLDKNEYISDDQVTQKEFNPVIKDPSMKNLGIKRLTKSSNKGCVEHKIFQKQPKTSDGNLNNSGNRISEKSDSLEKDYENSDLSDETQESDVDFTYHDALELGETDENNCKENYLLQIKQKDVEFRSLISASNVPLNVDLISPFSMCSSLQFKNEITPGFQGKLKEIITEDASKRGILNSKQLESDILPSNSSSSSADCNFASTSFIEENLVPKISNTYHESKMNEFSTAKNPYQKFYPEPSKAFKQKGPISSLLRKLSLRKSYSREDPGEMPSISVPISGLLNNHGSQNADNAELQGTIDETGGVDDTIKTEEVNELQECKQPFIDVLVEISEKPENIPAEKHNEQYPEDHNQTIAGTQNDAVLENLKLLMEIENMDLVLNSTSFVCPVCFNDIDSGQGVVLHDCLHTFCRECLTNSIIHSDGALVKCPYRDTFYSCQSHLQQREIKTLVTDEVYEKYLQRSITTAEGLAERSFHCKTPNCPGWCLYDNIINVFQCPVCFHFNCLNCQAIHEGLNCRQYQDKLKNEQRVDPDAEKTLEFLNGMIASGKALKCPSCDLILMKKWGCDWLKCSVCKTEICWITRGPRWGPGGKGDTSGGCRCGINGKKCHPSCTYCH